MDDQRETEAVEELSKAIAFRPELQTLHLRAAFHEATGKLSLAAQDCEAGLCLDPNHTETLHLYSRSERVLNLGLTSLMEHKIFKSLCHYYDIICLYQPFNQFLVDNLPTLDMLM